MFARSYSALVISLAVHAVSLGVLAALGASPRHLQWTVLRPALRQLAAGLVLGLGATFVFDHSFGDSGPSTMLDPVTIVPLIGAVVVVALTACLIPTRRAAHADPMHALRAE